MTKKKILMLGGAYSQIPAIQYAKQAGYHVITCDYLPDNPGHKYADEYHNVSTTDQDGVLKIARKLGIDGVVAYASDPSAPTAAFVSDAMGLPGASYKSVRKLAEKDLFRSFLQNNGFNSPRYISIHDYLAVPDLAQIRYPCFVKPVDNSGSKGLSFVYSQESIRDAVNYAKTFSRNNKVIIEEYIDTPFNQLHGDGFVLDGELIFLGLGDQHFSGFAPFSTTYPSTTSENISNKVREETNKILKAVGFKNGAINVEVRITEANEIFVIEIGPRCGGNYVPQLMQCGTGFDEVRSIVELAIGNKHLIKAPSNEKNFCLQYIIGSKKEGVFLGLEFSDYFKNRLQIEFIHKKIGDIVKTYKNSTDVIGVVIAKFANAEELKTVINNIELHVRVVLAERNHK